MDNTVDIEQNTTELLKKRGFWGWCMTLLRWLVIGVLAIALVQFLYLVFAVGFSFDYMWTVFGAVVLVECFLIFSPARLRRYLARKFVWLLKISGKVSFFLIRWGFVLLFAVILLGGLYFKAPWKILVLDGLLLVLMTIVPKKKRKYGWLALAAAVLAVAVWVFIPEKDTGNWRPYTFDDEVAALNAKYGVPDEENAAPYYEQIEATDFYADKAIRINEPFDFDWEPRGPALWDPNDETLRSPWKAEEFPELAAWLETEKEKIAPLWKAVQHEKCWFEVQTDPNTIDKKFQITAKIKKISQQTVKRMIYKDLADKNVNGAIQKALGLIQSSYHYQQQGSLVENLVGWAVYLTTLDVIRDMVVHYDLDEESLKIVEKQIALFDEDWKSVANRFLDYDCTRYKNILGLLYEVNDNGGIRFTRKMRPFLPLAEPAIRWGVDIDQQQLGFWETKKRKFGRFTRWMTCNTTLKELSHIVDDFYAEYRERLTKEKIEDSSLNDWRDLLKYDLSQKSRMKLTTEIAIPAIVKVQVIYRRTATEQKGTLIIIALRRYYNEHETWPETLEAIKDQLPAASFVDSLNGKEIIYKRPENCDSFILYSFGEDGIDDGGFRSNSWRESEKRRDDVLIWPKDEDELKKMLGVEEPEEPENENIPVRMMF